MGVSFDGIDDKLLRTSIPISSYPVTFYIKAKQLTLTNSKPIFALNNLSSNGNYFVLNNHSSGTEFRFVIRDGSNIRELIGGTRDLNWHTFAIVCISNTEQYFYIDGSLIDSNTSSVSFPSGLDRLFLGHWERLSSEENGNVDIDEFALWDTDLNLSQIQQLHNSFKGEVLNVENTNLLMYNPLDDYGVGGSGDGLTFSDSSGNSNTLLGDDGGNNTGLTIITPINLPEFSNAESIILSESFNLYTNKLKNFETILLDENFSLFPSQQNLVLSEEIELSENSQFTEEIEAPFASKIISINPLIFITDDTPAKISKIDTTDPENPTPTTSTIDGIDIAKDVSVDVNNEYIYVAGNNGVISKIEIADLGNQLTIDVSDSDDLLTIETNTNFGVTYAGTDNETGELYTIDERDTFLINSAFTVLSPQNFKIHSDFNIVKAFRIASNFNVLSTQTFKMHSDFKCLTKPTVTPPVGVNRLDVIEPIKETDYHVFLDGVELSNTDLVLNSISITHSVGEESRAKFRLTRKHDDFNTTLEGVTKTITENNEISIVCNGRTIFPFNGVGTGRISNISGVYDNNIEYADIEATCEEAPNKFNNITMSLPGLNSRLSLYDILLQNPQINNPYVDPSNEINPKKFKGIRVDLGTKIEQNISRFTFFDSNGAIADKIQEGTFNALQNSTYFWSPTVRKVGITASDLGQTVAIRFFYIGTSLAPVSEDLWDLTNAYHWRQKILEDTEEELGVYEVGEAPFKDVSTRNGQKITKNKFIDETNGLYTIKDAGYNFIEYAKEVADIEYENLKNINGNILPDTSGSFTMTIDAFLYYDISLLTRINIDNTTQSNIYNNSNGFPLGIKSIRITSSNRKVQIQASNSKSAIEINNDFPDEEDEEYNEPEIKNLIHLKTDMKTRLTVQ